MRALVVEDNVAQLNGLAEIIEESFPDIECLNEGICNRKGYVPD